jgi:hypothetical protein
MTKKRIVLNELTLWGAAKSYVVYLHSLRLPYARYQALVRALKHVLIFYGYGFPLTKFSGKRVLQYADIYNPFDDDPIYREYGQSFWKFVHWLKKNKMIPAWTAPETE